MTTFQIASHRVRKVKDKNKQPIPVINIQCLRLIDRPSWC